MEGSVRVVRRLEQVRMRRAPLQVVVHHLVRVQPEIGGVRVDGDEDRTDVGVDGVAHVPRAHVLLQRRLVEHVEVLLVILLQFHGDDSTFFVALLQRSLECIVLFVQAVNVLACRLRGGE